MTSSLRSQTRIFKNRLEHFTVADRQTTTKHLVLCHHLTLTHQRLLDHVIIATGAALYVLAHLCGWLRKHDLRYASVTETPHPPACITDLMAPWGVVSLQKSFSLVFFFHPRLSMVKPSGQAPTGNNTATTSSVLGLLHCLGCSHEQECVGVVSLITQM